MITLKALNNTKVSDLTKEEKRLVNQAIMEGKAGINKRSQTVIIF